MKFKHVDVQPASRQLLIAGCPAKVGARAFDLLLTLIEHRDRTLGKDELLERVWPGLVVEENNLQVHISALRKLLGADAIATIPGRGYRFTLASSEPGAGSDEPAAPLGAAGHLPIPRTRFIGREAALAECSYLLDSARLFTLTGIGGCGKTRLALHLAQHQRDRFADGVWFVDLASQEEPDQVQSAVATALGVRHEPGTPLLERLLAHLSAQCSLVVLDNCEQGLDAVAHLADALLGTCTELRIIVTSREALGLAGEQVFPVRALSIPADASIDAIASSEAAQLFIERARLVLPDFELDPANAAPIGEVCRRLDGIALAIELAAARVGMLSVAEIGRRLDDRFRFLMAGQRAAARHRTLEATLDWSHDSLSGAERRLFRELGVFARGCTLAAVACVSCAGDEHAALALLTRLHEKSLLVAERGEGDEVPRYRMLETVRAYARERLVAADDASAVLDRHLDWCAGLARDALEGMQGPQQSLWLARLQAEQDNLLAAQQRCGQTVGGAALKLQFVASLWRYWIATGQLERGYRIARDALVPASGASPSNAPLEPVVNATWRARAWWAFGQLAFRMGRYEQTLQAADVALALADRSGRADERAAGLILRAGGLHASGAMEPALAHFQEARELAVASGARFALVAALHGMAETHRAMGDLAAASSAYEMAIETARAMQDARAAAATMWNLARLSISTGQTNRARSLLHDGMALAVAAGAKGTGEHVLEIAAALAAAQGDVATAATLAGAADAALRESGGRREPLNQVFITAWLERARAALGDAAYAAAHSAGETMGYAAALAAAKRWLDGP